MNLNFIRKPIADLFSVSVDSRRETLEKKMVTMAEAVCGRAIKEKKWNYAQATIVQETLIDLYDQVVLGYATFEDFKEFCGRLEALGLSTK